MHKTEIIVYYNYGGFKFSFRKTFDLPFAPFFGLRLYDEKDGYDLDIELENKEGRCTTIYYYVKEKMFAIQIEQRIYQNDGKSYIDSIVMSHTQNDWELEDSYNSIDRIKSFLADD